MPYADVVTTTIHKTIGGGRGGMILCTEEFAKRIDSAVFPGQQGGPLEHMIAGKAVALRIAATEAFRERQERTVAGARAVADELLGAGGGVSVLTGGTDVHLVLCDLRESSLDGKQAEDRLHSVGITVNRNAVPFDPRPPAVSSGLRIGTPALATRGLQLEDFVEVGSIIAETLVAEDFERRQSELVERPRRSPTAIRCTRASARPRSSDDWAAARLHGAGRPGIRARPGARSARGHGRRRNGPIGRRCGARPIIRTPPRWRGSRTSPPARPPRTPWPRRRR